MKSNNFKIKALDTRGGWITKGKIYEFKNGQTVWDDGCKSGTYDDYKDLVDYMGDYLNFKEHETINESIIIYKKDNNVVAIKKENGQTVKYSKAKCHPNDTFDFGIGSKIAFDRLLEDDIKTNKIHKEEPYLKLVNWDLKDYGKVGKPTIYKDECGKELFVGDKVLTISNRTGDYSEAFVASDDKDFVMGIHCNCNQETGTIDNWRVVKIQDFSKTQNGDEIDGIKCVIS